MATWIFCWRMAGRGRLRTVLDRSQPSLRLQRRGGIRRGATDFGLDDAYEGRGVVCADFDNDGDTDILVMHAGTAHSATLWPNDTEGNNYLAVKLKGEPPNTQAARGRGSRFASGTGG